MQVIKAEMENKISNSQGEQNQHDALIRLNFKLVSDQELRQPFKLHKGFSQVLFIMFAL